MGHEVLYRDYPASVDKEAVQREWDEYARRRGAREQCPGLPKPIRWLDHPVCPSVLSAREYIEEIDSGWYDQVAVLFTVGNPETINLRAKLLHLREDLEKMQHKVHYADARASFISCRNCGSKLARQYLRRNQCPLCGVDMRPDGVRQREADLKRKAEALAKTIAAKEKQAEPVRRWLVKIEVRVP